MKVHNIVMDRGAARRLVAAAIVSALIVPGAISPLSASAEVASTSPTSTASVAATGSVTPTGTASATSTVKPAAKPKPKAKATAKKLTIPQQISKIAYSKKLSKAEVSALLWICKRESGFHPTEVTGSCYGLFQLSSSMVRGHPWKPLWNTTRAIRYMKGRYGGVLQAKSFWMAHHWY